MYHSRAKIVSVNLLLVLVLLLAGPVSAAPATQVPVPGITLSPASGAPGQSITVQGLNFAKATRGSVIFYWDSLRSFPIGTVEAVSGGSFTAPATIPPNAAPGDHTLIAYDNNSQTQATATFKVSGAAKRALYLYNQDTKAAETFQGLFGGMGMLPTDAIALSGLPAADLSKYDVILVGADTGLWDSADNAKQVTRLLRSKKPILALGDGGYQLFGKMKLPIGSPNGMGVTSTSLDADLTNPIYQTPYHFTGSIIPVYSTAALAQTIYLPKPVYRVKSLANPLDMPAYTSLAELSGRYYLWGYSDYSLLTAEARQLLINIIWQLLHYNATVDTLILTDFDRMTSIGYAAADVNALKAKVEALAALPYAQSNMVAQIRYLNLDGPATLQGARSAWIYPGGAAAGPGILSVTITNNYVTQIDNYIEQLKQTLYPNLQYVIIIGAHEVIPMKARDTDDMGAPYTESAWVSGLPQTSGYLYSLMHDPGVNNLGHYLTDSIYGDLSYVDNTYGADNELVPELGVGRLVETPTQISTLLDNYMAASAYLAYGGKASIASNDYMDGGQYAANVLGASADTSLIQSSFSSTLIPGVMNAHNAFVYLAGHGNYNYIAPGFLAGASTTAGDTEELNMLPNSVVVTSGCHNGVNFGNMLYHDYTSNTTYGEFPERMASRQVGIYLGATGYTWITGTGSSTNPAQVGVNEKLSVLFVQHLLKDGSASTPGKAFKAAVNEYLGAAPNFASYTRRVLSIATLYGIPNYHPPALMINHFPFEKYGYSLIKKWVLTPASAPAAASSLAAASASTQDITLQVNNWTVGADGLVTIPGADYTSGADTPILPEITSSQLFPPGTQVTNIVLDTNASQSTIIKNDVPLFQAAINGEKVPNTFASKDFYPLSPFVSSQTSTLGDGGVNLNLNIWPVQYKPDTHETKIWTKLVFHVTYSTDTTSASVDSDADGLPDYWESSYGLDPNDETGVNGASGDLDHDGLTNAQEFAAHTDPSNPDSDGDGIPDGQEAASSTDPTNPGSALNYLYLPTIGR